MGVETTMAADLRGRPGGRTLLAMPRLISHITAAAVLAAAGVSPGPLSAQKPAAPPPGFDAYVAQVM